MIKLTGSEKQIAWAEKIRNENIDRLQTELDDFNRRKIQDKTESYDEIISKIEKALNDIANQKSEAKWWIENKGIAGAFLQKIKNKK